MTDIDLTIPAFLDRRAKPAQSNEEREAQRRERNRKKWKQNTDRWDAWKREQGK